MGVNEYKPDFVTPPGETLRDTLRSLDMDPIKCALRAGFSVWTVYDILDGRREITDRLAMGLEYATKVPSSYWLNCQKHYDEYLEKLAQDKKNKSSTP